METILNSSPITITVHTIQKHIRLYDPKKHTKPLPIEAQVMIKTQNYYEIVFVSSSTEIIYKTLETISIYSGQEFNVYKKLLI